MTISNALHFIDKGLTDSRLREHVNNTTSKSELTEVLENEKFIFSDDEINEAFIHKLTRCQSREAADQLKEFKLWWDFLQQTINPEVCGTGCAGCST